MGWWSLYKWFRAFRKSPSTNYISWYKRYLYDEWYKELSDEDKIAEDERIKRLREEDNRRLRTALMNLEAMSSMVYSLGVRASGRGRGRSPYIQRDSKLDEITDAIDSCINSSGLM